MKRFIIIVCLLLLSAVSIQAQEFIGCRTERGWAESPMLSQYFHVDAGELQQTSLRKVSYAVTIASLGYHEVYVNGTRVGDRVMQPAVSQLDKHAFWVKYDITPYLREGHNQIMLWLGQGWVRMYVTPAVAKAVVEETVSDGECGLIYEILKTDSTWMAKPSPYSYTGSRCCSPASEATIRGAENLITNTSCASDSLQKIERDPVQGLFLWSWRIPTPVSVFY